MERGLHLGFRTYTGTVTAAAKWDNLPSAAETRPTGPSWQLGSALARDAKGNSLIRYSRDAETLPPSCGRTAERAIGVIYRPETERFSHYVPARLADQFDAVLHFDETSALVPLDSHPGWETPEELPEAFPFGV